MRPIPGPNGTWQGVELTKAEVNKLLQSSYTLRQMASLLPGRGLKDHADAQQEIAQEYGAKWFDANGCLLETEAEKRVSASVPE